MIALDASRMKFNLTVVMKLVILLANCSIIKAETKRPEYIQQERAFEKVPKNAAGQEALAGGVNPWHYWGETFDAKNRKVIPQKWRNTEDIIDGWDWSLPPAVKPAPNAKVRFGFHGWKKGISSFNPPAGLTVVDEYWIRWRQIEEVEGQYDFSQVEKGIRERVEKGCAGVIFRMLGAVWNSGTPGDWERWKKRGETWRFSRWSAPRWLVEKYKVNLLPGKKKGSDQVTHVDIFHPAYHRKYLELIEAFRKSGILQKPEVYGLIVCGMCSANGEEGHGTYELSKVPRELAKKRYAERIHAWQKAFGKGNENKVIAMLPDGREMVGARDGFVEMYHYLTDDRDMRGQYIDDERYLCVNEDAFYIKHGDKLLFGDENEEYSPERYADRPGRPGRYGPLESFNYRYFTSMLRMLQMRRNYLYAGEIAVNPHLLNYVLHELGWKVEDAPDAWCFLREGYLKGHSDTCDRRIKNFERWLYQRDRKGYETTPAIRIPHALKRWWLHSDDYRYDYVARRGKKIGFAVDDRFLNGSAEVAVKVSFYDGYPGSWQLRYKQNGMLTDSKPVYTTGKDAFRTATFFINADFDEKHKDYDFEIISEQEIPISFVRVIKYKKSQGAHKQPSMKGEK